MQNRKIAFRAWDVADRKMMNWHDIADAGIFDLELFFDKDNENVIPMQFTGLLDAKGKEIYEGDIIEWSDFNGHPYRRVVVYLAPQFYLAPNLTEKVAVETFSTPFVREEIIGNIYEKPELIK